MLGKQLTDRTQICTHRYINPLNAYYDVSMRLDQPRSWRLLEEWLRGPVTARPRQDCGLVLCEPAWSWQMRINDYDLWLVVDGYGSASIDGTRYNLSPGDLLHLGPGARGEVVHDPLRRFTIAYCHYDWWDTAHAQLSTLPASLQTPVHVRLIDPVVVQDRLQSIIRLAHSRQLLADAERSILLNLLLVDIYRQQATAAGVSPPRVDPRVEHVLASLRANPRSRPTLDDAARSAGMSPQYFSRTFTKQVGMSYRDYLLDNRLNRVRTLLAESTMTIGEIARALGYSDTYLLSRQVTARFGQSPTRLRSSLNQ